jgi:predicted nucleic acid-binding protein
MLVVDTNVVVRYLTNDNADQAARSRRLIEQHDVLLPLTVMLEAGWVLRSVYGFPAAEVVPALRAFAGLPRVTAENAETAKAALSWADQGLDFSDALHLAAALGHEGLASFDRALAKAARAVGEPRVREP